MSVRPKVSVLIITYNHERFIKQAVRSALAQETDFDYEIVIGDDRSTDGTRGILQHLDAEFPGRLRVLYREHNLGAVNNFRETYADCRGEYIALLEGDDFWTDPTKLTRQVAALDGDPGCALCSHPVRYVDGDGLPTGEIHPPAETPRRLEIDDLFRTNLIQTCSVVLRHSAVPALPDWMGTLGLGDWPLFLLAADTGHVLRLDGIMAAYRVHPGGLWTQLNSCSRIEKILAMLAAVDRHYGGKYARQVEAHRNDTLRWLCGQKDHAARESEAARQEAATARSELAVTVQELTGTRAELAFSRQELTGAQAELAFSRQELTGTRQELADTRAELARVLQSRSLRLARAVGMVPRYIAGRFRSDSRPPKAATTPGP